MTEIEAIASMVGRNHSYPSPPQYNVSESAAAELTLARPKRTRTTLGKQHMDAMMVDVEMSFTIDLTFFSSSINSPPRNNQKTLTLHLDFNKSVKICRKYGISGDDISKRLVKQTQFTDLLTSDLKKKIKKIKN